jgi:hypothetical protein
VITVPAFDSEIPNKRIFFLDGVSEPVAFLDIQSLENVQFFPYRLNYSVEPNPAIEVRKRIESLVYAGDYATAVQLADSADLSPRSKILLKYLTRDYEFILNKDSASNYLVRYSTYRYEDGLDLLLNRVAEQDYHEKFKCEELQYKIYEVLLKYGQILASNSSVSSIDSFSKIQLVLFKYIICSSSSK